MPALTISYKTLPRAVLFIQILFIILSVIYITCFYYLLTFRREKVYIMNALIAAVFPYVFLRPDSWRIPQQRASHPLFLFFYSGILRSVSSRYAVYLLCSACSIDFYRHNKFCAFHHVLLPICIFGQLTYQCIKSCQKAT